MNLLLIFTCYIYLPISPAKALIMKIVRRLFAVCAFALSINMVVGCGENTGKVFTVSGKVILPSQIKLEDQDSIELRFAAESSDGPGKGAATSVSAKDLSFSATNVPPGKYKIVLSVQPYAGTPGSNKRMLQLEPFNKSNNMYQTKLTTEIGSKDVKDMVIDFDKKSVTGN
jgi:hypothetical protein